MARVSIGPLTGSDVVLDEAIEVFLTSPAGPVAQFIGKLAARVATVARANAPVGDRDSVLGHPAGYLRSQIGWRLARDSRGIYADIISPAKSSQYNPFDPGGPYAVYNELPGTAPHHAHLPAWILDKEGPYLRPALASVMGSL